MSEAKLIVEDQMIDDRNRALRSIDVIVERTLVGRPMDLISLPTAINCISADGDDTPIRRKITETMLRRGNVIVTTLAEYRVARSQVVTNWTPAPEVAP